MSKAPPVTSVDNALYAIVAAAVAPLVREQGALRAELAAAIERIDNPAWIPVSDYAARHKTTVDAVKNAIRDERLDPPPQGRGRMRRVHPAARILPPKTKLRAVPTRAAS